MMIADNCCEVQNTVNVVFPGTQIGLNVWHFITQYVPQMIPFLVPSELINLRWSCDTRYIMAILNPSKNPYRTVVAADVTNTILKTHAEKGKPAQYWNKDEQEERLISMYNKWASKGTVWSAAAQKVCNGRASNTYTAE